MKTVNYNVRKLFDGHVIGKEGLYVAVPDKLKNDKIKVSYDGQFMLIENWHKAEAYRKFDDKWGRGNYTLGYFKWEPIIL